MRKPRKLGKATLSALIGATVLSAASASAAPGNGATGPRISHAINSCTSQEKWSYGREIPSDARAELNAMLSGSSSAVRGFSEALALRKFSMSPEAKVLGEYGISRALLKGRLPHIAYAGFSTIASRKITPGTAGVQLAALDCMNAIHVEFPTFNIPASVQAQLGDYLAQAKNPSEREAVWKSAGTVLRTQLADGRPQSELDKTLALLKGSGQHEPFAKGLVAAKRNNHTQAVSHLEKFFASQVPRKWLMRYHGQARLILARAYYSMSQFGKATAELQKISRGSNELAKALSELTWGFLMNERYNESIGTAMSLQAGGLRQTFAPEAPMVMAMAMNELCQFPESVRAVNVFRKHYETPYRWLAEWNSKGRSEPLYPLAVQYLKKAKHGVPNRVASEWVRSPLFISHQGEINLLFDEIDSARTLGKAGQQEQRALGTEILKLAKDLKPRLATARIKAKPGEPLPKMIRDDLSKLKYLVTHYKRFLRAAPVWRTILANHERQVPRIEKALVAKINEDLKRRSTVMLGQLEEIAENNQLIEVEIYNGASQDIIWQNAHPDYKKIAKKFQNEGIGSREKVWDWGRAPAGGLEENSEIWEDELGSFKADVADNCSNKDKYLALKRNGR